MASATSSQQMSEGHIQVVIARRLCAVSAACVYPYNALEIDLPIKDSLGSSYEPREMVATQLAEEVLPGQQGSGGAAMSSCQETGKR